MNVVPVATVGNLQKKKRFSRLKRQYSFTFAVLFGKAYKLEKFEVMTDPISDYLTRLRNAIHARHKVVEMSSSKMKLELTKTLYEKGYIDGYEHIEGTKPILKIALKYTQGGKVSAIAGLKRVSRPGLRQYTNAKTLPRVLNGLGIAIISTSKGVITDKEARNLNVGGEVICYIS